MAFKMNGHTLPGIKQRKSRLHAGTKKSKYHANPDLGADIERGTGVKSSFKDKSTPTHEHTHTKGKKKASKEVNPYMTYLEKK